MPRAISDSRLDRLAAIALHAFTPGFGWGALAGVFVGTGISLTIGLFYSEAISLIFSVIFTSVILGAFFGQSMQGLLNDETGYVPVSEVAANRAAMITELQPDVLEHQSLLKNIDKSTIYKQSTPVQDQRIFALIQANARQPSSSAPQLAARH